ncbi:MAG: amino acid dehydrogenase [Flavobacteriales bacterium]|nr:amino acid dehydrogenase [Flavobacteriales bacterium]
MKELITQYESTSPEIIFEWNDSKTNARGWIVINSLRGGASGGGTRMRKGLTLHEVTSLAKTMEVKFTVSGPQIGGAKSGIDFDPKDERKEEVLKRWFKAVSPLLKSYYGTGGDMNINEARDVVPITESYGLWHPQEGIVEGHFNPNKSQKISKIGQLRLGVPMIIANPDFSPDINKKYSVSDMITGYGVAQSVIHYYSIWKNGFGSDKSVLIQGWGNVGASAGFFLSKAGFKIKGIMDKEGYVLSKEGFTKEAVKGFFLNKENNILNSKEKVFDDKTNFWNHKSDVFLPCAGSRLVSRSNLDNLIKNGCELIASGANVPFDNEEILYGKVMEYADNTISVIPDFIANCGMARTFGYCMQKENEISSKAIFKDVSDTIYRSLKTIFSMNSKATQISQKAIAIAIKKIL